MLSCVWLALLLVLVSGSGSSTVPLENLKGFDAFQKIEAEDTVTSTAFYSSSGCSGEGVPVYMYYDDPVYSYLGYYDVDFGTGAQMVSVRLWGFPDYSSTGRLSFHLDGTGTVPFATLAVGPAGTDPCNFITLTSYLSSVVSGVRNVFIFFTSVKGSYMGGIDWFYFNQTVSPA